MQGVVVSYFSFATVTQNEFLNPTFIQFPSLHICFTTFRDAINRRYFIDRFNIDIFSDQRTAHLLDNITVREILDNTPMKVIDSCVYRDESGNEMEELLENGSNRCNTYFTTQKYISDQYVCYKFQAKEPLSYNFRAIESSVRYEKVMYVIGFKRPLSCFRKIRFTLTGSEFPHRSKMYSPSFYKAKDERMSANIYCQNFTIHSLGHPYDRYICDKFEKQHLQCYDDCVQKSTIHKLNRDFFQNICHGTH